MNNCKLDRSPVFIVGEARSGTSVLGRCMEAHSSFRPKKLIYVESKIMSYCCRAHRLTHDPHPFSGAQKYMMLDESVFGKFLDSIGRLQKLHRVLETLRLIGFCNRNIAMWKLVGNCSLLRQFFEFAREARCCKRIIEKTPNNAVHVGKLRIAFPESKMIYIHRHPIDVYTSYVRLTSKLGKGCWADLSVEEFCQRYETRANAILSFKRRDIGLLCVRYEDFVEAPREILAKIFAFVGEEMEEDCIDPGWADRPDPTGLASSEIMAKSKEWSDWVDGKTAMVIEQRLAKPMSAFGYASYSTT